MCIENQEKKGEIRNENDNSINVHKRAALIIALMLAAAGMSRAQVIYNSIPSPLPGNVSSLGFEATSTDQFGDRIVFSAGTGRKLVSATQTMSSWGCESGHWTTGDCLTTPGATFSHPITLTIYNVGVGNTPGSVIGTVTQTFNIPYRPSADPVNCTGADAGKWFDGTTCYNGYATNITFNLTAANITVPNDVIYGISYNTSTSGNAPIGTATACFGTPAGCGYDSLNVGLEGVTTVGSNFDADDAWWDTAIAGYYCDGGAGGVDIFRRDPADGSCNWTGYQPAVKFIGSNVPTNANQCKNNGWQTRTRADGSTFKNQGDCIQYVNTGK